MLGADTHGDRAVALVGGGGQGLAGDGHDAVAELHAAVGDRDLDEVHRRGADEARHEEVGRPVVHVARRVDLLQQAVLEDRDPVAHGHGLDLVVGDVHGGDAEATLQPGDLGAGLHAQLGVQVRQRLVHEEDLRLAHDGAAHRHALPLAAGEGLGLAAQVLGEVEDAGRVLDLLPDLGLRHARDLQGEAHVVGDGHVRIERVVLEHHGDVPVLGRQVRHVAVADADRSAVDVLQAREHAQRGGFAAAGGADEDEELAVLDGDVELVDGGLVGAGVDPGRLVVSDRGHGDVIPSPAGTCRTIRVEGVCGPVQLGRIPGDATRAGSGCQQVAGHEVVVGRLRDACRLSSAGRAPLL